MRFKKAREARKHKLPLPNFTASKVGPDQGPVISVISLLFGILSGAALAALIANWQRTGVAWAVPVGAAGEALSLMVVLLALFVRGVRSSSRAVFQALELDIVLENLSPAQIRARYVREVLGPSIADWLEGLDSKRRSATARLRDLMNGLGSKVEAIEAIDTGYTQERSGRARALLTQFKSEASSLLKELRGISFLARQLKDTTPDSGETEMLHRIFTEWDSDLSQIDSLTDSTEEIRKRLADLAGESH